MSQHRKRLRDPLRYTLTELEEDDWGPPTFDSSLVQSVHRLRHVPLKDLSAEDLRLMIGEQVGLRYLIPLALDILAVDPFTEGNYYSGDLLHAVIGLPREFWSTHTELASRAGTIARGALAEIDAVDAAAELRSELQRVVR